MTKGTVSVSEKLSEKDSKQQKQTAAKKSEGDLVRRLGLAKNGLIVIWQ